MKTSYTRALAELVPIFFPDLLYRLNNQGQPVFPEFAAAIKPTEFAPGKRFGSRNALAGRLHARAWRRGASRRHAGSTSGPSRHWPPSGSSVFTSRSTRAARRGLEGARVHGDSSTGQRSTRDQVLERRTARDVEELEEVDLLAPLGSARA